MTSRTAKPTSTRIATMATVLVPSPSVWTTSAIRDHVKDEPNRLLPKYNMKILSTIPYLWMTRRRRRLVYWRRHFPQESYLVHRDAQTEAPAPARSPHDRRSAEARIRPAHRRGVS